MKLPIVDSQGNVRLPEGDDVIITTGPLVGLGDHAIYSTLPERFSKLGYTVYVDVDNAARNDEIMDVIWRKNPFVAGVSEKKPNAGYVRQGLFYEIANRLNGHRAIEAMERAHGLPPPYGMSPSMHYTPKGFHLDLSATVLVDFSAVSSSIEEQGIGEFLRAMKGRFRNAQFVQLLVPKWVSLRPPPIACDSLTISSIYEYLDVLSAARAWIGSEAGGQSLASCVRGEVGLYDDEIPALEVVADATIKTFNSRGYTYRNVDYHTTQFGLDKTGDYFFPDEMNRHIYELRCAMSYYQMRGRRE